MQIDGACLCGHVRYEATIDPDTVVICHCTDCQVNSAGAFRYGTMVARENFRLLAGTLKVHVKTAESGARRALSFCPDCGTSIHGADPEDPKVYSLRLGTARQRHQLTPKAQVWHRSAVSWLGRIEELKSFETQPAPRPRR